MRVPRALSVLLLGLALTACGSGAEQQAPSAQAPNVQVQPTVLRIPSIGVDAQNFIRVGLQGPDEKEPGAVQVPDVKQPMLLGWYCPTWPQGDPNKTGRCGAPAPGDTGPAVLLGHINGGGNDGVFAKLAQVKKGDTVEVLRDDRYTAVFKVTEVEVIKKAKFPTVKVYGDTSGAELRLITCGGGDNELVTLPDGTHSYVNQTIVYAQLTELKPTTA